MFRRTTWQKATKNRELCDRKDQKIQKHGYLESSDGNSQKHLEVITREDLAQNFVQKNHLIERNQKSITIQQTKKDRKDPKNPEPCDRKDTQSQNQVNKNLQKHLDVIIREILETQSNVYPELSDGKHPEVIIREEPETQNYVSERRVSERKEFPEPENTQTDWCQSDGIHDDQTSSPRTQGLLQILLTVLLPASSSQLHLLHFLSNLIPHLSLLITPENNTME